MSTKIDVRHMFAQHVATLKKQGDESPDYIDLLTFYGVPALISLVSYLITDKIKPEAATQIDSVMVSAFSVFAALLLNAQVLIIGLLQNKKQNESPTPREAMSPEDIALYIRTRNANDVAISELFVNISYAILTSLVIVSFTLLILFFGLEQSVTVKSVQFFGLTHFSLTALMILKRLHVIFSKA